MPWRLPLKLCCQNGLTLGQCTNSATITFNQCLHYFPLLAQEMGSLLDFALRQIIFRTHSDRFFSDGNNPRGWSSTKSSNDPTSPLLIPGSDLKVGSQTDSQAIKEVLSNFVFVSACLSSSRNNSICAGRHKIRNLQKYVTS